MLREDGHWSLLGREIRAFTWWIPLDYLHGTGTHKWEIFLSLETPGAIKLIKKEKHPGEEWTNKEWTVADY
uniref:PLAT domain-containing protein n=1 Tax=Steinernema glaseri TaxID=37863 RepID=A0A1I8AQU7_9BILA